MATLIHVVGLGVETAGRLNPSAEIALRNAVVIIGARRQLDWLAGIENTAGDWPPRALLPPLAQLEGLLDEYDGEVAIVASGDPLYFGIGRWLGQRYPASRLHYHSAVSSIQTACSRLGIALQDCTVLSLHGRPLESLQRHLHSGRRLILLTDKNSQPAALADACIAAGLDASTLWVCARLGYPDETIQRLEIGEIADLDTEKFDSLQVSVLELRGSEQRIPSFPGIADTALCTDGAPGQGMITKREVRLQILTLLQSGIDHRVWDVGAGCGGVATELALWQPSASIFAIEQEPTRLACLSVNRTRFGTTNLNIIAGRAPLALQDLPDPDRVFIGGSDGELSALLSICWQRLAQNGVLVASAVTAKTRASLEAFALEIAAVSTTAVEIALSQGSVVDGAWRYRDKRPVTLFRFRKPGTET